VARRITYQQAINEALGQEMERDESVVVMGEDIAGGMETAMACAPCSTAVLASSAVVIPLTTIGSLVASRAHVIQLQVGAVT